MTADGQPETGSAIEPAFCNTTTTTLPNGLPPGWCMQGPVQQVSLWYDKTVFLLKNESDRTKRAVIRRTLLNGKLEEFTFDVNYRGATDQIVWSGKTDRGTLELIRVSESPDDDSLSGLVHISMEEEPPGYIRNRWSVPAMCLSIPSICRRGQCHFSDASSTPASD
ncbi:hypothetical protein AWB82_01703 [Caballeronia glebae]|uniref:Uncharacterized protein n=1 Tax=Caballeronia glebae TaxID=1777143 RepID=A0A158A4F4_9BURK|nr:hypothetical protein [Caballeronia glebae]SAK52653.1 hypothetical protein AWB82_01703 [Caballeronia glebae]